jgi:hypothetical protein
VIAHLSYVMCDECGSPGEVSDDADEARAVAKAQGFVRIEGRDLCRDCKPAATKEADDGR